VRSEELINRAKGSLCCSSQRGMIFEISTQETCPWYHELIVSYKYINNFRREIIR